MRRFVTGCVLLEVPGGALNMAGQDRGSRTDNAVKVKAIRLPGGVRVPYVSGQAWRRWLRDVLHEDFAWAESPILREDKNAYTEGDPIRYEEDDIFGYMSFRREEDVQSSVRKRRRKKKSDDANDAESAKKKSGKKITFKRISPLRNSILLGLSPAIESDFGVLARGDMDPVPFESELYLTWLQGAFTLALGEVGRFKSGEMFDIPEDVAQRYVEEGLLEQVAEREYKMTDADEIRRRVRDVLLAMAELRHGANLARNLVDVTPVAVVVGFVRGGNAPFQNLFKSPDHQQVQLDLKRFASVLRDFEPEKVLVGLRPGVLLNETDVEEFCDGWENVTFAGTPKEALHRIAEDM